MIKLKKEEDEGEEEKGWKNLIAWIGKFDGRVLEGLSLGVWNLCWRYLY